MKIIHLVPTSISDFVRKDIEHLKSIKGIEVSVMRVGWSGRSTIFNSILSILRLLISGIIIRLKQPDVVHAHFFQSIIPAVISRIPTVATIHESRDSHGLFWRSLFIAAARHCNRIYVSKHNRDYWKKILGDGVVIYHAIDQEIYNPSKRENTIREAFEKILGSRYLILTMAGLNPERGLHIVVKGVSLVRQRGVDAGLIIKGYGKNSHYTEYLKRLANQLAIPFKIIQSTLSDDKIAQLLASADVFARATYSESFGIAPLEAQACGTPIVVTDCCSLQEIFHDSSLRFPKGNYTVLADQIYKILTDTSIRLELIETGLRNARRLSWKTKIEQYIKYYNKALL